MLTYVIDKTALWERAFEEISSVADDAYADDGTSLYDSIILTDKDKPAVERYIDDAVSAFVRRAYDICKPATIEVEAGVTAPGLQFYVPDFDSAMTDTAKAEITNYLGLYAATEMLKSRRAAVVPEFSQRVQSAMDRAVVLLKSRKAPNESWS